MKVRRERWWTYGAPARSLYRAITNLQRVIAIGRVSKAVLPAMVANGAVFSDSLVVFASDDSGLFAFLSSNFHWWWAVTRASTMRTDTRYTPTDCFLTLPVPELNEEMRGVGSRLDRVRRETMAQRHIGMTDLYNLVWSPNDTSEDIGRMRASHAEIDRVVAHGYGWDDLALDHDFHETRWGIRYTVAEVTQREILDRLLELNHARHAHEVADGVE
jgi:hypothetical protein